MLKKVGRERSADSEVKWKKVRSRNRTSRRENVCIFERKMDVRYAGKVVN